MAAEGFQPRTEGELPPTDLLTSSLASLHLREEAVVTNENAVHMGDNPEPDPIVPVMMSLLVNQSCQQADICMATRPEPPPADQGKIKVLF